MEQELWLNLPVKDLEKSKAFFLALGFKSTRDNPGMIGFEIGGVPVMMIVHKDFQKYTDNFIADTSKGSEMLISIDAPDRNYLDEMVEKVISAGGTVFSKPQEIQGWMYNMGFADLDGHRWNVLYMDKDKMTKD